jgi:hypothetical protein
MILKETILEKKVYIQDDQKGRTTTAAIAQGTEGEIGIRSDRTYTTKGDLIVEYYNCSDALYEALSSEYCYTTLVSKKEKPRIVEVIRDEAQTSSEDDDDWLILRFLENSFSDYDEVRQWLLSHHVPYRKFYDGNWGVSPEPANVEDAERLARLAHA